MLTTETPRWALLTSNEIRHRYLGNILSTSTKLVAVVSEPKRRNPADRYRNENEREFLSKYFNDRSAFESQNLSEGRVWNLKNNQPLVEVGKTGINDPEIIKLLLNLGVTHCLVFGTSWLKGPWLKSFSERMVNLHLGLSPYLRGAGTNFWALCTGHPELFGATLHLIDAGIDSGPILFHVRPEISVDDNPHTLGNKTIAKSARAIRERFENLHKLRPTRQWRVEGEREYKMRDFDGDSLKRMLNLLNGGLLKDYVEKAKNCPPLIRTIAEYEPPFPGA